MSAEIKSYDRQYKETIKAYDAFCVYRDMGTDRTQEKACEIIYPPEGTQEAPRNISQIRAWSGQWKWVDRCKDYDRDEEAIARERKRELSCAEHDAKLAKFQENNEELGSEMTGLSLDLTLFFRSSLAETVKVFETPIVENEEKPEEAVKLIKARQSQLGHLFTVSQICKTATTFATVGGDLTADGLLIRQMLEKLKEGGE
jgi:hypothetical protein